MVEFMQKIDALALVEQDIAVPKTSLDRMPQRSACRRTRRAEQLVVVPTIVSYSSLQHRTAERIIDIPVPQGRGDRGSGEGLQGVRPGQNSTARTLEQFVDIPVPQGRDGRGGLQGSRPGPVSTASSSHSYGVDEAFSRVLRTFHQHQKSARLGPHSGSELGPDFNPWTPAAYADSMALEETSLTQGRSWSRGRRSTQ